MLRKAKPQTAEPAETAAPKPVMTMGQAADQYMIGKAPARQKQVGYLFQFFDRNMPVEQAATLMDDYRIWMTQRGHELGTIANRLKTAKTVFLFARRRKWLEEIGETDVPRDRQPIKSVPDDELKAFMKKLDGWPKLAAVFLLNTGLRKSELLNLKLRDIGLDKKLAVIRDTKNGQDRYIPLNKAAMKVLTKALSERQAGDTVFPTIDLNFAFRSASEKAKVSHVTPHMLRHTFATRLAQRGVNLEIIRSLGGWKKIDMAARYAQADLRALHAGASLISDDDF